MFRKFAKLDVLEVRSAPSKVRSASLSKFADFNHYRTDDGYVYVRVRAISSRVNKNHDGWPSEELKKGYRTFIGKPIFVDHNNHDPKRARGVIVDAQLHVEDLDKVSAFDPYYASAPDNHKPPTWIELLLEVDAKKFPKLAKAVVNRDIDGVSMGANVERTQCSHCANWATTPDEYCDHVRSKGAYFDFIDPHTGQKTSKRSYEDCYDCGFFEISFVFDPADETALTNDIRTARVADIQDEGAEDYAAMPGSVGPEDSAYAHLIHAAQAAFDRAFAHTGGATGESQGFLAAKRAVEQAGYPTIAFQIANEVKQRHLGLIARAMGTPDDTTWLSFDTPTFERHADRRLPEPQADMTKAPDKVNTLRQEQTCPVCGSSMEDGVCEVCNYEEPPEGFDNPDLEKAGEVDQQMRQQDAQQAAQGMDSQTPNSVDPTQAQPAQQPPPGLGNGQPMTSSSTSNVTVSAHVTSEKTAAKAPTTQERPILPVTRKLSDKPVNVQVKQDATEPKESSTRKEKMTDQIKKTADGATADGGSQVQPDRRVDVIGVGGVSGDPEAGTSHENVEKAMSQEGGPHTDTWSKGEGDALGQHDPVTGEVAADVIGGPIGSPVSKTKTADGPSNANEVGGPIGENAGQGANAEEGGPTWDSAGGFPDHDPTRVKLDAPLKEEVGERTKTFKADDYHVGDPVTSEGVNDNVGGPMGTGIDAPMKEHHPSGVPATSAVYAHAVKAMKLAETEVALDIIGEDDKFNRVAELEDASVAEIDAALNAYSKVKTAKAKSTTTKTAGATRMPSFSKRASVEPIIEVAGGWNPEDSIY